MTHLQIIREAYDRCGIKYAILSDGKHKFVILAGSKQQKNHIEELPIGISLLRYGFIEFDADGQIASY